jgi:diguanylate cyclase (GGDEF)-like protein
MTPTLDDLVRRALVMRRLRAAIAVLVPVEMLLYVPPPHVDSALHPVPVSLAVILALSAVIASSAAVHRQVQDVGVLARWAWAELVADGLIVLGILQAFAFDQFSSLWTMLIIIALEGAFRGGLRGALLAWAGSQTVYVAIQLEAAHRYPLTAPLDPGSIVFRALIVGMVAFVAGHLASQLQAAIDRHARSEAALAEQYADLRLIGRVSRAIAAGPEAREDVCQAVAELASADVVMLYEPSDGNLLRGTAAWGCPLEVLPALSLDDPASGTAEAFLTRRPLHRLDSRVPLAVRGAVGFPGAGARSSTFVPVVRDGRPIGVLVLAFGRELAAVPPRVARALDVLAEEAAVAISRADTALMLAEQARRDALTGLVNRRGWEEALEAEMSRARRTGAALSVLMLDLDGLKVFNDTHGHQAGDRLIASAADAWATRLRPTDVLARFGGDEFVALLPGCEQATAVRVADALIAALPAGGSCSAGVAEWDGAEGGGALIARADAALYAGKRSGGGRTVPAPPAVPRQRLNPVEQPTGT